MRARQPRSAPDFCREAFKSARAATGLTQKALANGLVAAGLVPTGITSLPKTIGNWETGDNGPSAALVVACATFFDLRPRDLFDIDQGQEVLVHLRVWAGLNQLEAAAGFGWSRHRYVRWEERGEIGLKPAELRRAAKLFSVSTPDIVAAKTETRRIYDLHGADRPTRPCAHTQVAGGTVPGT